MILRARLFATALACAIPTFAQVPSSNECKQHLQSPLPSEASQVPAPKQWPECNSYKLYSGIGTKVDYAAARQCAWSERLAQLADLQPKYTTASLFGGSAIRDFKTSKSYRYNHTSSRRNFATATKR
jgi:hypothetical protein